MTAFDSFFSCCMSSPADGVQAEASGVSNVRLFTFKELSFATESFSPITKIGEGGFGPVFKGRLKNGKLAAIKVLSDNSRQGVREFLTEIQVISEIQHENLVQLYGCCAEGNKRIVVYNYLENSSLQQTLLAGGHNTIHIPWETRYKIGVGIAKGLAFLHEEVRPYIIHRDIKASNILLDNDFTPKISDFGLAKVVPPEKTHVSTRVAGTVGYLAPEYAVKGQLTRKADIYSFGVLLLEIVSGRCNTNSRLPSGEQYLLERAWQLHERRVLITLVDESMEGMFDTEEAFRFLTVALLCTQESPKLRPQMSAVVKMLTGEKRIDENNIMKPGIINDFLDLKVKDATTVNTRNKMSNTKGSSSSSGSYQLENSTFSWGNTGC